MGRRGDIREEETSPRAFNIRAGRRRAPMYQVPAFRAGIRCGSIREEERCRR
jgi:hypothetical protein